MALTEEQFDVWWKENGIESATFAEKSAARKGWKAAIAALPKPEAVYHQWRRKADPWSTSFIFSNEAKATSDDSEVRQLYTEAPIAQPASGPTGFDAEFLAKRLGRVAKLAGVSIPERFTHEQVAEAAGTILGQIAAAMEAQPASVPSEQMPFDSIDDAIKHAIEVSDREGCSECGDQHRQLAVWLTELRGICNKAPQPDHKAQCDALLEALKKLTKHWEFEFSLFGIDSADPELVKDVNESNAIIASVKGGE